MKALGSTQNKFLQLINNRYWFKKVALNFPGIYKPKFWPSDHHVAFRVWRYTPEPICMKKYMLKNLSPKNTFCHFKVCNIAASVWWTFSYDNKKMKHFRWKRRQCNVMKKKNMPSIKYIRHNKQLKKLFKFIPMNMNQQI